MDAAADYSRYVSERVNWSCINSTLMFFLSTLFIFSIFSFYQIYAIFSQAPAVQLPQDIWDFTAWECDGSAIHGSLLRLISSGQSCWELLNILDLFLGNGGHT
jgi:hypothetical protein